MILNEQKVVNYVVKFMRKQKRPASRLSGFCDNVVDNRRCAIACCFKMSSARKFSNDELSAWLNDHGLAWETIGALRRAHDQASKFDKKNFVANFEATLKKNLPLGLTVPK